MVANIHLKTFEIVPTLINTLGKIPWSELKALVTLLQCCKLIHSSASRSCISHTHPSYEERIDILIHNRGWIFELIIAKIGIRFSSSFKLAINQLNKAKLKGFKFSIQQGSAWLRNFGRNVEKLSCWIKLLIFSHRSSGSETYKSTCPWLADSLPDWLTPSVRQICWNLAGISLWNYL